VSGIDPNGAGALVVPGGVSTIAAADITDASAAGRALLTAANAAAQRAALGVYSTAEVDAAVAAAAPSVVTYDFSSGSGWTAQANNGSASVTSGVGRLTCATDPSYRTDSYPYVYGGPALARALDAEAEQVDVAVRIASMPATGSTKASVELATALSAGVRVSALAAQNGAVDLYRNDTNTMIATVTGAFGSYTGQEWLRLRSLAGFVTAYYGVGVGGARPTSWTSVSSTALARAWTHAAVGMTAYGSGTSRTVDLDDFTVLATPVVSL